MSYQPPKSELKDAQETQLLDEKEYAETLTQGLTLLLGCFFMPDGSGDLINYIDATHPNILKTIPGMEHHTIYRLIICPQSRKQEAIQRLSEANMFEKSHLVYYQDEFDVSGKMVVDDRAACERFLKEHPDLKEQFSKVDAVLTVPNRYFEDKILDLIGIQKHGTIPVLTLSEHGGITYNLITTVRTQGDLLETKQFQEFLESQSFTSTEPCYTYVNNPLYRHMGFAPEHHGILIQSPRDTLTKAESLCSIGNKDFLQKLLNTQTKNITLKQCSEFLERTMIVPGYIQEAPDRTIALIEGILESDIFQASKFKELVFIVNPECIDEQQQTTFLRENNHTHLDAYFIQHWYNPSSKKHFNQLKISQVKMTREKYFADSENAQPSKEFDTITLEFTSKEQLSKGRTLRILAYRLQNDKDYHSLVRAAHPFYICSGDKSFELAISHRLFPIFQAKPYKLTFLRDLIEMLADNQCPKTIEAALNAVKNTSEHCTDKDHSTYASLGQLMAKTLTPQLLIDWEKALELIHRDYNLYSVLPLILQQLTIHAQLVRMKKVNEKDPRIAKLQAAMDKIDLMLSKKQRKKFDDLIKQLTTTNNPVLPLSRTHFSAPQYEQIFKLAHSKPEIDSVDLRHNTSPGMDVKAYQALANFLAVKKTIKELELSHNKISSEILKILLEALKNTPIENLSLDHNPLGNTGILQSLSLIEHCPTLMRLSLDHVGLTDAHVEVLCSLLKKNTQLVDLSLQDNFITEKGIAALEQALQVNKSLKVLELSGNRVKNKHALNPIILEMNKRREKSQTEHMQMLFQLKSLLFSQTPTNIKSLPKEQQEFAAMIMQLRASGFGSGNPNPGQDKKKKKK